jgi:hypothetical protein
VSRLKIERIKARLWRLRDAAALTPDQHEAALVPLRARLGFATTDGFARWGRRHSQPTTPSTLQVLP